MIKVEVRGVKETEHILSKVAPKHALALTRQTVGALASEIMRNAKTWMNFTGPYSTGRMRRSTKKRVRRTRRGIVQNDIVVERRAFYWRFYEYGDGNVRRRRMFGKSIDQIKPVLGRRFNDLLLKKLVRQMERERAKVRSRTR